MTQNKYVMDKCFHFKMKAKHKEPDEHWNMKMVNYLNLLMTNANDIQAPWINFCFQFCIHICSNTKNCHRNPSKSLIRQIKVLYKDIPVSYLFIYATSLQMDQTVPTSFIHSFSFRRSPVESKTRAVWKKFSIRADCRSDDGSVVVGGGKTDVAKHGSPPLTKLTKLLLDSLPHLLLNS